MQLNPLFNRGNAAYGDALYCAPSFSNFYLTLDAKPHVGSYKVPLLPLDLEVTVINYISRGEWLYVAAVCKRWRKLYLQNCRCAI